MEIEKYFYENFKQEDLAYVFYTDLIDFFLQYTDFDMLQVSRWIKKNLTIIDGKVVDICCICDPQINNTFEDVLAVDSS
jgi:hypothetical protein